MEAKQVKNAAGVIAQASAQMMSETDVNDAQSTMDLTREQQSLNRMKSIILAPRTMEHFSDILKDSAPSFLASLLELCRSGGELMNCDPMDIIVEAEKAAVMRLPINKNLGFAWIIPRRSKGVLKPIFQIGAKGLVQLAQRTGLYRYINDGVVYEGQYLGRDMMTGNVRLSEESKVSDKVVGYFAYIELLNGFNKCSYWTVEETIAHAQKYAKGAYDSQYGIWKTNPHEMGRVNALRGLLTKYGVLSVEDRISIESYTDTDYEESRQLAITGQAKQISSGESEVME